MIVDREYKEFRKMFRQDPAIEDPDRFWTKVRNLKDGSNDMVFSLIIELYDRLRIFPHSSAACESVQFGETKQDEYQK